MGAVKKKSKRRAAPPSAQGERYRKRYERLKEEIRKLGLICQGSITKRYLTCGKSACACQQDPSRRHGPYYHWTRKVKGRTQGRLLPPDVVPIYREGIRNYRRLEKILEKMKEVSLSAMEASRIRSKG